MGEKELQVSDEDLARYLLYQQGLVAAGFDPGRRGMRQVLKHLGAIQYDTLNPVGRNHDLVLQARLPDYRVHAFAPVIYGDEDGCDAAARAGFEYWDKALCILPIDRYPLAASLAERLDSVYLEKKRRQLEEEAPGALAQTMEAVRQEGPLSGHDLRDMGALSSASGSWTSARVGSAALEILWNQGTLSIAHRWSGRKYYDLTERVVPENIRQRCAPAQADDALRHLRHRVETMGLLPTTGAGDAWASIKEVKREKTYERLVEKGELRLVRGDGRRRYLAPGSFERLLAEARQADPEDERLRFIAPLDSFMWDRELVEELFDFHYVWEVYKPEKKRVYGYYVLPVLWRGCLVGRIDPRFDFDSGTLRLHSVQWEAQGPGLRRGEPDNVLQRAFEQALDRFASYLQADAVRLP